MNTKAAVILMIGLLGAPVAYNFTLPVADDWVFYGGNGDSPSWTIPSALFSIDELACDSKYLTSVLPAGPGHLFNLL